jgi:catechol 2,3-dioxygenase-like lactoylglutathione lyase family enzyme
MAMIDVRILHTSIQAPAERVYAFVAEPRNMPRWAPNFGHAITPADGHWIMHTAEGPVPVRFAPPNELGVLDHWVRLPGGEIHNPMRVVPHGAGSVLTFTLWRQEGWTDTEFDEDAALVSADLATLKALIEAGESPSSPSSEGGRSKMKPRLDAVGIVVQDMARSLAFYRELGLDIAPGAESEPHVEATLPGGVRILWDTVEVVRSFDADWQPPSGGHRMGLAFLCGSPAEVDAAYERLTSLGYHGHKPPWDAFWGQRYAVLHDPDGNGVDLFAPNG